MNHEPSQKRPSFFWQGALLLFPVAVFALTGLWLLEKDRWRVEQEAVEQSQKVVQRVATYIGSNLGRHLATRHLDLVQDQLSARSSGSTTTISSSASDGSDAVRRSFEVPIPEYNQALADRSERSPFGSIVHGNLVVDGFGALVSPPAYPELPTPASGPALGPDHAELWRKAAGLGDAPEAIPAWKEFLGSTPPAPALNQARWRLAQALLAASATNEAVAELDILLAAPQPALSEAGLPLAPLAAKRRFDLVPESDPAAKTAAAQALASNAVFQPSIVSELLLADLKRSAIGSRELDRYFGMWENGQGIRAFAAAMRGTSSVLTSPTNGPGVWVAWRGRHWLVATTAARNHRGWLASGDDLRALHVFPESLVLLGILELLDESRIGVPDHARVEFEIAGRALGRPSDARILATATATWVVPGSLNGYGLLLGDGVFPGLVIRARLQNPEILYALQRERTRLFSGLIGGAVLVSLFGFVVARRAFHRQLALNQQKSDFVSAVSHELRAPIAAVRLMTENLTRGAPAEPERRQEYFRLILQECRRLSALIENVLDFSRIEQGRKEYEFEPTDLRALCQATVALMQPIGSDHGVGVQLTPPDPGAAPDAPVDCDGRAIQQALVNLIDNAIKHSPAGASVRVALAHTADSASISVSDRGPGIPPKERERVFEQFHRLGSELRRETQGVGIGLSIVRHIVSSHGGRVWVEDGPEGGSRFTMELPRNR